MRKVLSMLRRRLGGFGARNGPAHMALAEGTFRGRQTISIEWEVPTNSTYPFKKILIHLCRDRLLPLAVTAWGRDGQLQASSVLADPFAAQVPPSDACLDEAATVKGQGECGLDAKQQVPATAAASAPAVASVA